MTPPRAQTFPPSKPRCHSAFWLLVCLAAACPTHSTSTDPITHKFQGVQEKPPGPHTHPTGLSSGLPAEGRDNAARPLCWRVFVVTVKSCPPPPGARMDRLAGWAGPWSPMIVAPVPMPCLPCPQTPAGRTSRLQCLDPDPIGAPTTLPAPCSAADNPGLGVGKGLSAGAPWSGQGHRGCVLSSGLPQWASHI